MVKIKYVVGLYSRFYFRTLAIIILKYMQLFVIIKINVPIDNLHAIVIITK